MQALRLKYRTGLRYKGVGSKAKPAGTRKVKRFPRIISSPKGSYNPETATARKPG